MKKLFCVFCNQKSYKMNCFLPNLSLNTFVLGKTDPGLFQNPIKGERNNQN